MTSPPAPGPTPRRWIEQHAGPLLVLLARLPRVVPFLVVLALLVTGLLVGGPVGGLLLLVLTSLLAVLVVLAWPALPPQGRVVRVAVTALLGARALSFFL